MPGSKRGGRRVGGMTVYNKILKGLNAATNKPNNEMTVGEEAAKEADRREIAMTLDASKEADGLKVGRSIKPTQLFFGGAPEEATPLERENPNADSDVDGKLLTHADAKPEEAAITYSPSHAPLESSAPAPVLSGAPPSPPLRDRKRTLDAGQALRSSSITTGDVAQPGGPTIDSNPPHTIMHTQSVKVLESVGEDGQPLERRVTESTDKLFAIRNTNRGRIALILLGLCVAGLTAGAAGYIIGNKPNQPSRVTNPSLSVDAGIPITPVTLPSRR